MIIGARLIIRDLVSQGHKDLRTANTKQRKLLLLEILKEIPSYDSHVIFVDADKKDLLPELFQRWLKGEYQSYSICEYIFQSGIDLFSEIIDGYFEEELQNVYNARKYG